MRRILHINLSDQYSCVDYIGTLLERISSMVIYVYFEMTLLRYKYGPGRGTTRLHASDVTAFGTISAYIAT